MTHEYVIATGGIVLGAPQTGGRIPTAVGWAADRILAVGSDAVVTAISRGDSTFIDVEGCAIGPAPNDPAAAERLIRSLVKAGRPFGTIEALGGAGLLETVEPLEAGAPADLAFWDAVPETSPRASGSTLRIVAVVRRGAFTEGDEHLGPFRRVAPSG